MRTLRTLAIGLAVAFLTLGAQAQQRSVLTRHVRDAVVNGQAPFVGLLPATQRLGLAVMLPLRNQAGLEELLRELYDPQSPSYHQWLSVEQFTDSFGPSQEDYDAVLHFVEANGMTVTGTYPNRLVLDVTASVASIDRAFHLTMGVYQHPTENRTFYASDREPTLDLGTPLWHISGLDNYSIPHPLYVKGKSELGVKSNTTGSGPGGDFLGSDRRAAYCGATCPTGSGQSVGLFELDGYNPSDVQLYFTTVRQALNVPITNVLLLGASGGSDGEDTEQVIDIIEAVSMAPGLSQILVYIAPNSGFTVGTSDTDIFTRMATDNIAKQLSVSWLWTPDDPGKNDTIFEEFAMQGQSLFVASGDYGSWPNPSYPYYYPPEDANVTAVGGTDLTTSSPGGFWESEIAWGGVTSRRHVPKEKESAAAGGLPQTAFRFPAISSSPESSTPRTTARRHCETFRM